MTWTPPRRPPSAPPARLSGQATGPTLDVPAPRRAFAGADGIGTVALLPDRSLCLSALPQRVWDFAVSGYPVLHRWLRARNGEPLTGAAGATLLRAALDVAWRIEELLYRCDQAGRVLTQALDAPLTRADLGLHAITATVVEDKDAPE